MNKRHTKEAITKRIIEKYLEESVLYRLAVKWLKDESEQIVVLDEEFADYAGFMGMKVKKDLGIAFWGKTVRRPFKQKTNDE